MRIGSLFLLQAALTLAFAQSRIPAWRHIGYDLPASSSVVEALIADPGDPPTIYGISDRSLLYKSTDGSNSWRALSGATGVYSLLIDPRNPATLYAGTSHGVLKSTDGGSTWSGINTGLPPGSPAWVQVLAIDPAHSSVLYVEKWQGLFKSTDGGQSWTSLNARFYGSDSATTPLANIQPIPRYFTRGQPGMGSSAAPMAARTGRLSTAVLPIWTCTSSRPHPEIRACYMLRPAAGSSPLLWLAMD